MQRTDSKVIDIALEYGYSSPTFFNMVYHIAERQPLHIVGIRIPMVEDMEENLRIVSDFWKVTLQANQFSEICKLSNQEPNGILGISVYESPKEIYYYIGVAANVSAPVSMHKYEIPEVAWVIFENSGIRFVSTSQYMDIPKYGLQSKRRTDKKCII